MLKDAAWVTVKEKKTNVTKPFWSEELSKLKWLSIEAHTVWVMQGRPHQGIINDNRLLCKSRFKKAIRLARCKFDWSVNNSLADGLLHDDYKSFWAKWHSAFSLAKVNSVNFSAYNCVADVAQEFANCFERTFMTQLAILCSKDVLKQLTELVERKHLSFCQLFTTDEVRHAVSRLKCDKAVGFDGVTPEMVINAGKSIVVQLMC